MLNGTSNSTSSNPSVATISGSRVNLVGHGISTITVIQAATTNYTSRQISTTLYIYRPW